MKTLAVSLQSNFIFRFYRYFIIDSLLIAKREGVRELLRQRGWRVMFVVGGYYLVRDTIVYLIIPYCIARGLF